LPCFNIYKFVYVHNLTRGVLNKE